MIKLCEYVVTKHFFIASYLLVLFQIYYLTTKVCSNQWFETMKFLPVFCQSQNINYGSKNDFIKTFKLMSCLALQMTFKLMFV